MLYVITVVVAIVSLAIGGVSSYFITSKLLEKKLGNAKSIAEKTIKDAEQLKKKLFLRPGKRF